jgi:hypothetical protein
MKTLLTAIIASLVFGPTAIAEPINNQKLAGVWLRQEAGMRCTNTVAPDGSFTEQAVFVHPGRTNTYQMAGTWQIKDGRFIESVTNDSNMTARVPRSHSGQIVFVNTNEFVVSWPADKSKTVWQRISP